MATNLKDQLEQADYIRAFIAGESELKQSPGLYLYRDADQTTQRWVDYVNHAKCPDWCRIALDRILGYLAQFQGGKRIALPAGVAYLQDRATVYSDGIDALAIRIANQQAITGRCGLLVEPTEDNRLVIKELACWRILRVHYETTGGRSLARFALLDNSRDTFNPLTKQTQQVQEYIVLGIDDKGDYYTATIHPEQWASFNPLSPAGNVVYPTLFQRRLGYIPLTIINTGNLSGASYSDPYLLPLAILTHHAYNADAAYRRTLRCTSDPTLAVIGGTGEPIGKLSATPGSVNWLPSGYELKFTEFSGAGAEAQRAALKDMSDEAEQRIMAVRPDSDLSGAALSIIVASQQAGFARMVDVLCDGVTIALSHAADWSLSPGAIEYRLLPALAR